VPLHQRRRPVAVDAARSAALVIAMVVLIYVLLPAALGAAGPRGLADI